MDDLPVAEFQHRDGRPVGRVCKACRVAQTQRWVEHNRERSREIKDAWIARNPEKHRAAQTEYAKRSQPKRAEWKAANRDKVNERNRELYRNDPSKFLEREARRKQREGEADGVFTRADRIELLESQGWQCASCSTAIGVSAHADHIVPLVLGGSHDRSNRQMLCAQCNHKKGVRIVDFRPAEQKHGVSIRQLP